MRTQKPTVLLTEALPEPWLAPLREHTDIVLATDYPDQNTLDHVEAALTMLTVSIDTAWLDRLPRLRVLSQMAVGVDNIDLEACASRSIAVGHTPGVLTDATADLCLALMLAFTRNIISSSQDASHGRWITWSPVGWLGSQLSGKTIGIVGMGAIGRAVAERCRGFGCNVIYWNRTRRPDVEIKGAVEFRAFDEILAQADIVSLHVALTKDTHHLIGASALSRMKSNAVLINTARGDIIDQNALVDALKNRRIAGAALDVTSPEPLPMQHELYRCENCLITPHIGSATFETRQAMAQLAIENLLLGLERRPLRHAVLTPGSND